MTIDLNADLGEEVTDDAGLLSVVTSANVACGAHAGNAATMARVCAEAAARGVAVGAHVSYPDRVGFGRNVVEMSAASLSETVAEQIAALTHAAGQAGISVSYLKPHGALYHRLASDAESAAAVLAASADLPIVGLAGGRWLDLAKSRGRRVVLEGFPDRGYLADGSLIPRGEPRALVTDVAEIAANAVRLASEVETVCVHGDSPGAVAAAVAVRAGLEAAGYVVRRWS